MSEVRTIDVHFPPSSCLHPKPVLYRKVISTLWANTNNYYYDFFLLVAIPYNIFKIV